MDSNSNRTDQQFPLYMFGFLGFSCYASCALISLFIGIGWLLTSTEYVFNLSWEIIVPIFLIIWGVIPIVGYYFYQRRKK